MSNGQVTISLSRRPNLDPKPWRSVVSGIRYRQEPDDGFGPYVFDPRPELDVGDNSALEASA